MVRVSSESVEVSQRQRVDSLILSLAARKVRLQPFNLRHSFSVMPVG